MIVRHLALWDRWWRVSYLWQNYQYLSCIVNLCQIEAELENSWLLIVILRGRYFNWAQRGHASLNACCKHLDLLHCYVAHGLQSIVLGVAIHWKCENRENRLDVNFVVTDGTASCHSDNMRCLRVWQSWHYGNYWFSMLYSWSSYYQGPDSI